MILRVVFASLCVIAFAAWAQQPADVMRSSGLQQKRVAFDFQSGRVAEVRRGFLIKVAKLTKGRRDVVCSDSGPRLPYPLFKKPVLCRIE